MTAQVLFNPLAYIDRLTRGGFSPEQARASAEALETAFTESVATKSDLAASEARLMTEMANIRTEIAQSKNDTLRWMFAFILALVGAVFGILKLVH